MTRKARRRANGTHKVPSRRLSRTHEGVRRQTRRRLPRAVARELQLLEDRRRYQGNRWAGVRQATPVHGLSVRRAIVARPRATVPTSIGTVLGDTKGHLAKPFTRVMNVIPQPRRSYICARRKIRREVLFALGGAAKKHKARRKISLDSKVRC